MGMELNAHEKHRVASAAAERKLAPTGPVISKFNPLAIAAALEQEAHRAKLLGEATGTPGKVDIYMDPEDALLLAKILKKKGT